MLVAGPLGGDRVIVNQNRRVRTRGGIGEDPQEGFGEACIRSVEDPMLRNRVLWARILFDNLRR